MYSNVVLPWYTSIAFGSLLNLHIATDSKTIDTIETILEKVNQKNFNYSLSLSVKSTLSI